jgi:hypothetical protein
MMIRVIISRGVRTGVLIIATIMIISHRTGVCTDEDYELILIVNRCHYSCSLVRFWGIDDYYNDNMPWWCRLSSSSSYLFTVQNAL